MLKKANLAQLIPLCQEYKKYIENDSKCIIDIDSCDSTFHTHPQLLIDNFIETRKQFYRRFQKMWLGISAKEEFNTVMKNRTVQFVINHFGIQNIVFQVHVETKNHQFAVKKIRLDIYQTKRTDWEYQDRLCQGVNDRGQCGEYVRYIIIAWVIDLYKCETQKSSIDSQDQYFHRLLRLGSLIVNLVDMDGLSSAFSNCSLSHIERYVRNYAHKQKRGKLPINICASDFYTTRLNTSKFINKNVINVVARKLHSILRHEIDESKQIGLKYIASALHFYKKKYFTTHNCNICTNRNNIKCKIYSQQMLQWIGTEKFSDLISNGINYHHVKVLYVVRICVENCLYKRIKVLNQLSVQCFEHKELIALKLIKCSYKLSNGFIEVYEKYFVLTQPKIWNNARYMKLIQQFKNAWLNMKCNNCRIEYKLCKLKACSGCMVVAYCSKQCQKVDWKLAHKEICNKSWLSAYKALTITLFDRI
eukprot:120988_1